MNEPYIKEQKMELAIKKFNQAKIHSNQLQKKQRNELSLF